MTELDPGTRIKENEGDRAIRFIEKFCVHGEGDFFGLPFHLEDFQKDIIRELYQKKKDGSRKYREAMIGLPKGNGKSELAASIACYELLGNKVTSPLVAVAAASYEQASIVFKGMQIMCKESSYLRKVTEVYEKEIQIINNPGRAYRVAAVAGTADGQRNSCFIADEIHEWTGNKERVHYVLSNNTAKRKDGLILNITTAGFDKETLAGRLYDKGKKLQTKEVIDDEFFFHWLEADPDDDPEKPETWAKCNPAIAAGWWDINNIKRRFEALPLNEFKRYHLNQWTRSDDEAWITDKDWNACLGEVEFNIDDPTWLGVDMALRNDSVAIVAVQKHEDEKYYIKPKIYNPLDGKLDYEEIENYIKTMVKKYNVIEVAYDSMFFERSAQVLAEANCPMTDFPQSHSRMVPACGLAWTMISNKEIVHAGEVVFTDQVLSGAQKQTDSGWRISKNKSRRKIDGAIAMVMALDRAARPNDRPTIIPTVINL